MSDMSPSALAALAKVHLNLPPETADERVPRFYLDELRRHLSLYPNERDFRVKLTPGVGFGSVICLKDGCNTEIKLVRRTRVADGGKREGFGALSPLRVHITSASHKKQGAKPERPSARPPVTRSRGMLAIIEAMKSAASSRKSLPSSLSSAPAAGTPATRPSPTTTIKSEASLVRIKPEPSETTLPRKRLSDFAFDQTATDQSREKEESNVALSLAKKVKREPTSKAPFVTVTNTMMQGSSQPPDSEYLVGPAMPGSFYDTQDPAVLLNDVRIAIAGQQSLLHQPIRLSDRKLHEIDLELARLSQLQQHYSALVASTSFVKAEPVDNKYPLLAARGRRSLDQAPLDLPQPPSHFPALMDVDENPFLLPRPIASTSQIPFTATYPGMQASFRHAAPTPALKHEPQEKKPLAESNTPFATGHQYPHPDVARSSADPEGYESEPSDSDASHYGLPDMGPIQNIIDRVGINAPPPIDDDAIDDNGDYHGRGRDLFEGPQAQRGDFENFIEEASKTELFDRDDSVDRALKELELKSLNDKLPGMEITLMKHQVLGVAWMLKKEQGVLMGGCLADEMGLGKTVQMMACIVLNPSKDKACRTTLILAPTALLDQWKAEIESKTNCGLKVLIYHGQSKPRKKSEIIKHDVVLTTYHTMSNEWPDYENEMKKKAKAKKNGDNFIVADSDEEDMKNASYRAEKRKQKAGLLFQIEFYRIIADEAQNVRNRRTRISRAMTDLQARYRWCLTGTPIVNSLADVYGILRFLRIRPWYDWSHFHKEIGLLEKKRPSLAVTRLQTVMNTFILRRKKDSMLDGVKLVDLPPKKIELVKLEFSEEEREIYNMVEARSQARFNRYLREGTVLKNYHQVLVLLLRLRQVCSHPCLIQEGDGTAFVRPDEAKVKAEQATELTRARRLVSAEFVVDLKRKFLENALERMRAERQSANATVEEEDCPICYDAMTDAVVTPCKHIFCRECIVDFLNQPAADGAEHKPDQRPCPVCRSLLTEEILFSRQAFEPTEKELHPTNLAPAADDEDMSDIEVYLSKDRKGKEKAATSLRPRRSTRRPTQARSEDEGGDVFGSVSEDEQDDDDDDMSDFIVQSDEDEEEKDARLAMKNKRARKNAHVILDSDDELEDPEVKEVIFGVRKKVPKDKVVITMSRFLPSTKMKYMMDQLQTLVKTKPEEKTLVVSQWTGCLSLVSDYLTEKGIPHVKYQGDMSRNQRDRAVQVFMSKEKARVMLMSLKCGGIGLNLTRANNVISLDLGWSQAVESQAFDRVHRVGQVRDVLVQRVVIADTVENRILTMQERKQTLADGSLGEGSGKKIGKLSVKELANLFGLDARGHLL